MSEDDERINPDENWKAASTRSRVILALAQADGQPWASLAEATEHTAEIMYGQQADAVLDLLGEAAFKAMGGVEDMDNMRSGWALEDVRKLMLRVADALGVGEEAAKEDRTSRIAELHVLPAIERLRAES